MPNLNYRKGASYERRFVNDLLKTGKAVRADRFYASRGVTDVFWVEPNGQYNEAQLKYSQDKPYISPKEREVVCKYAAKLHQIQVWIILKSYREEAVWEKVL